MKAHTLLPIHRKQTTIDRPSQVSGFGFWSGRDVTIEFRPAPANTGLVFVRADLPDNPRVPALVHHRVQGPRRTTLVHQGCAVELVEHVLAAAFALQIDNCEIWVDRPEIPGCDGSSQPFVDALIQAGRVELNAPRPYRVVTQTIQVGDSHSWVRAEPIKVPDLELTYNLNYECPAIGSQSFSANVEPAVFVDDVAPARTFVLKSEADQLQERGLGRRVEYSDILVFDDNGPIENQLRFDDECARHKLLDMIGDFALIGCDLFGKFTAHRSGHYLNAKMAFAIIQNTELNLPLTTGFENDSRRKIA